MIEKVTYITDDGKVFEDENEAYEYETKLRLGNINVRFYNSEQNPCQYDDSDMCEFVIGENTDTQVQNLYKIMSDLYAMDRFLFAANRVIFYSESDRDWIAWGKDSEKLLGHLLWLKSLHEEVNKH